MMPISIMALSKISCIAFSKIPLFPLPLTHKPPALQQCTLFPRKQTRVYIPNTMHPSPVSYNYIDEVERLEYYVQGGYHPVMLGDTFCEDRYTIVHKLGFGRPEDKGSPGTLVALKILTAESVDRTREK